MRRAGTRTSRGDELLRIVWIGRGMVRNTDRRILVSITDLESRRAKLPADIADELRAYPPSRFCSSEPVVINQGVSIAVLFLFRMEFGCHAHVSSADRPAFGIIGRQQGVAA